MERLYRPDQTNLIKLTTGEIFRLETQRIPVVPPYLMIIPFVDFDKDLLQKVEETAFEGEGVHGCTYRIRALSQGSGNIRIGFRDISNSSVTHETILGFIIR